MNWYLKVLKQYADFNGRARRKEFWMFILINFIFSIMAGAIDTMLGTVAVFSGIYAAILFIPSIAVSVRRLHDIDKSGWMFLVGFIPVVGIIWLLILLATDSEAGNNAYGKSQKL